MLRRGAPMPIKSYLAYPVSGRLDELAAALRRLPGCEVIPAVNRDLLVLVTDSPDEAAEAALGLELAEVPALQALALVAGLGDAAIDPAPPISSARHSSGGRS
jgi:hypothetical protein